MKLLSTKKILGIATTAIISTISFNTHAAVGLAGCGLGSIVIKENTKGYQILAATTNGTFGNQTFGITSGTSNCGTGVGKVANNQSKINYVNANLASLEKEGSQGSGSTLNGLAAVIGCPTNSYSDFAAHTQANYNTIFTSNVAEDIVVNINQEISKNPELARSCNLGNS